MSRIEYGNPFDHSEFSRESTKGAGKKCEWCGATKKTLYKYNDSKGWFCSKDCYRQYYDIPKEVRC